MTHDLSLQRLVLLAERSPDAARATGLRELPYPVRFAISDLFAQIAAGERAALACARRMVAEEPSGDARDFARTQVRDEQRHLAFFERAMEELAVEKEPLPQLTALLDHALAAPDLASLLLGNNLVVETMAHEMFLDVARAMTWCGRAWWLPGTWSRALGSLGAGMQTVYGDESRHVAFGTLRLRALCAAADARERERIEALKLDWRARLETTLKTLPVATFMRPWMRRQTRIVLGRFDARCKELS